MVEKVEE